MKCQLFYWNLCKKVKVRKGLAKAAFQESWKGILYLVTNLLQILYLIPFQYIIQLSVLCIYEIIVHFDVMIDGELNVCCDRHLADRWKATLNLHRGWRILMVNTFMLEKGLTFLSKKQSGKCTRYISFVLWPTTQIADRRPQTKRTNCGCMRCLNVKELKYFDIYDFNQ